MDFIDIVIRGYADLYSREHLKDYFYREFKKAEEEYFEVEEFFNGCFKIIELFENQMLQQFQAKEDERSTLLGFYQRVGHFKEEVREIHVYERDLIKEFLNGDGQIKSVKIEDYSVILSSLPDSNYNGEINYSGLRKLRWGIQKAYEKAKPVFYLEENNTTSTGVQSIKYSVNQLEKIFNGLEANKIVSRRNKDEFLSIFSINPKGYVNWDQSITKAGLFYLMEDITGRPFKERELKIYFRTKDPIHRNWRDKNGTPTKIIYDILKSI